MPPQTLTPSAAPRFASSEDGEAHAVPPEVDAHFFRVHPLVLQGERPDARVGSRGLVHLPGEISVPGEMEYPGAWNRRLHLVKGGLLQEDRLDSFLSR